MGSLAIDPDSVETCEKDRVTEEDCDCPLFIPPPSLTLTKFAEDNAMGHQIFKSRTRNFSVGMMTINILNVMKKTDDSVEGKKGTSKSFSH